MQAINPEIMSYIRVTVQAVGALEFVLKQDCKQHDAASRRSHQMRTSLSVKFHVSVYCPIRLTTTFDLLISFLTSSSSRIVKSGTVMMLPRSPIGRRCCMSMSSHRCGQTARLPCSPNVLTTYRPKKPVAPKMVATTPLTDCLPSDPACRTEGLRASWPILRDCAWLPEAHDSLCENMRRWFVAKAHLATGKHASSSVRTEEHHHKLEAHIDCARMRILELDTKGVLYSLLSTRFVVENAVYAQNAG